MNSYLTGHHVGVCLFLDAFLSCMHMISISPRLFVVALLLGGFVFSGCGMTNGVEVTENGVRGTDVRTGDAVAFGDDIAIPATFPADFPKYPGARTQAALHDTQQNSYTVNQQTGDGVLQVKAWAEGVMAANGFTKMVDLSDAANAVLSYEKGSVKYQVQASRDEARSLTYVITVRVGG